VIVGWYIIQSEYQAFMFDMIIAGRRLIY